MAIGGGADIGAGQVLLLKIVLKNHAEKINFVKNALKMLVEKVISGGS